MQLIYDLGMSLGLVAIVLYVVWIVNFILNLVEYLDGE